MHKEFDFEYDASWFFNVFNTNPTDKSFPPYAKTQYELHTDPYLTQFYKVFDFVQPDRHGIELCEILKPLGPYISPRNNGLLIFPISGLLEFKFYSYIPKVVTNGRPVLNSYSVSKAIVEPTLTDIIRITKPTAINGLVAHMYQPVEPSTVILALKIPMHISWDTVINKISQI